MKEFVKRDPINGRDISWSPRALWFLLQQGSDYDIAGEYHNTYSILDVAHALSITDLSYIELEGPNRWTSSEADQKYWEQIGGTRNTRYVHFSLSNANDVNCAIYEAAVAALPHPQHSGIYLKSNQCVAASKLEKPTAKYAIEIQEESYGADGARRADELPLLWKITELQSNQSYAWVLRRESHSTISCPTIDERKKFIRLIQPIHHEQ